MAPRYPHVERRVSAPDAAGPSLLPGSPLRLRRDVVWRVVSDQRALQRRRAAGAGVDAAPLPTRGVLGDGAVRDLHDPGAVEDGAAEDLRPVLGELALLDG